MKKQSGFAVLEILLIVVVVAAIGFAGVSYLNNTQTASNTADTTASSAVVPSAPEINTAADLAKAENMVDTMDVDASENDSTQIDTEESYF